MIGNGNPYLENTSCLPRRSRPSPRETIFFILTAAIAQPRCFTVQGGCTHSGGLAVVTYPAYQLWQSNLYWRADGLFASEPDAFHVQPKPVSGSDFSLHERYCRLEVFYFCGMAGAAGDPNPGEDPGSVVKNPGFNNPTYPADDYSLPGGTPGVGFAVFDPTLDGRSDPVINPPAVHATFLTKPFDPTTDF